jgi:hypothetical protein
LPSLVGLAGWREFVITLELLFQGSVPKPVAQHRIALRRGGLRANPVEGLFVVAIERHHKKCAPAHTDGTVRKGETFGLTRIHSMGSAPFQRVDGVFVRPSD